MSCRQRMICLLPIAIGFIVGFNVATIILVSTKSGDSTTTTRTLHDDDGSSGVTHDERQISVVSTPSYNEAKSLQMMHYGTVYGGHKLPTNLRDFLGPTSIAIMAGVGEDITFDVEIAAITGATIHLYDPTPRAILYVERVFEAIRTGKAPSPPTLDRKGNPIGAVQNEIMNRVSDIKTDQIVMHSVGMAPKDEKAVQFLLPKNPDFVSASARGIMPNLSNEHFVADVQSLTTILKDLGDDASNHVDMFKVNIEGLEIPMLDMLLASTLRPKLVCVTYDVAQMGKTESINQNAKDMEKAGYVRRSSHISHSTYIYTGSPAQSKLSG